MQNVRSSQIRRYVKASLDLLADQWCRYPQIQSTLLSDTSWSGLLAYLYSERVRLATDYNRETSRPVDCKGCMCFRLTAIVVPAIGIVILIASQVQVPSAQQSSKETVVSYLSVSIVFFITGCTLPTRVLIENYARWRVHLFVTLQCFLMTSATVFAIVTACATNKAFMDPALLVGLIIWSCLPTTISSNVVMTRQAHGNQALTVVETTIGNFIAPFLSPVLVQMYLFGDRWYTAFLPNGAGTNYSEIYRRVFKQLGLSIYLPMAVGQIVQHFLPAAMKKIFGDWKLNKLGSLALLMIVWSTFDQAFESGAFSSVKASNHIFIVFISIAFFLLWLGICFPLSLLWLSKRDTIALCYCVPAKSIAIGVPLSSVLFVGLSRREQSQLQIPMVIFQGLQIPVGSLMTLPFRRWVRPEEEAEANAKAESDHAEEGSGVSLQRAERSRSKGDDADLTRTVSFH